MQNTWTYISLDTGEMNAPDVGEIIVLNSGKMNILSLLWVLFLKSYISNLILLSK